MGATVSYSGVNYTAAFWSQGSVPSSSSGAAGSGQPWISTSACAGGSPTAKPTTAPTVAPTSAPTATSAGAPTQGPPPPTGFVFSQYKDITVNMNWNNNVISSTDTGNMLPLTT
ncbi:MAG TPA: hypothetical protein VGD50_00445, partial [Candidatus Baltobacteraceae bacterium]